MPVFLASLLGGLISISTTLVGRVLVALSIGYVTYSGLNVLLTYIKDSIWMRMGLLPGEILNVLAYMQVDVAVNILFSAVAARLVIKGVRPDGKLTKMVIK